MRGRESYSRIRRSTKRKKDRILKFEISLKKPEKRKSEKRKD